MRSVFAVVLVLLGIYNLFIRAGYEMGSEDRNCQSGATATFAHWASRCSFTVNLSTPDATVSEQRLAYEKRKLDAFALHGGVDAEILWYRAAFHRRFMENFHTNFQELHYMHLDYTLSEHGRLDRQVEYLDFLIQNDLLPLAVDTLNSFCDAYLPHTREDVVEEFEWRFLQSNLPLKLDHCISLLGPTAIARMRAETND